MPLFDKYINEAPAVVSETPNDFLPKGVYPGETISGKLEVRRGTGKKSGVAFEFADPRVQIRVTDGPMKGQTTWVPLGITLPDPVKADGSRLDDAMVSKITYFAQKLCDATGLGKKIDPNWARTETPDPKRPTKTITKFTGKMLKKAHLVMIADNPAEKEAFEEMLKGLTGIFTLDVQTREGDAGTFEGNVVKGVEPITDATLAAWRTKHAGTGAPAASGGGRPSSIYDQKAN